MIIWLMNTEQFMEWKLAAEGEVLWENLAECYLVDHKSHIKWSGINPGRRGGKPATNHLSYGTARLVV
jgi:hypothetical protein